jgi:hypothetical protein
MAEITRTEFSELSSRVTAAETRGADLSKLSERVHTVEMGNAESRGAVGIIKWAVYPALLLVVGGLVATIWGFGSGISTISERTANLVLQISGLEKRIEKFESQKVGLTNLPAAPPNDERVTSLPYHSHEGKIVQVDKDNIVAIAEIPPPGEIKYSFPISSEVEVKIKGKEAKISDLKPGMLVRFYHRIGRKVDKIDTIEPIEPLPE